MNPTEGEDMPPMTAAAATHYESLSQDAFVREAVRDFAPQLIGYATGILKDHERAKDAVQDTFIKLTQQPQEAVAGALKSWLYAVCRNRALDILRKERRMIPVDDEEWRDLTSNDPDPSEEAAATEDFGVVTRFLQRLPENQAEVIRLKFQYDSVTRRSAKKPDSA
ncbi:MAG: sigma-70 family RNA polymerase sigma factor [Verrucomicrobiales bacterium]